MQITKRILFVDDSPRDTELAMEAFSRHNLAQEVEILRDGVDTLDYLYRRGKFVGRHPGEPVVILLDLKMPRIDGFEVIRQVKGDPDLRQIPIVVMTSSREGTDLARSYELGVNAYIVKPIKFDAFTDAVSQVGSFWARLNVSPSGRLPE